VKLSEILLLDAARRLPCSLHATHSAGATAFAPLTSLRMTVRRDSSRGSHARE
jgi:hypothetical protein